MKSLLGYNIKLLYSPLKWICCFNQINILRMYVLLYIGYIGMLIVQDNQYLTYFLL